MPTPNTITVPHGIRDCTSFQVITPIPGISKNTSPAYVVEVVRRVYDHGDAAERRAVLLALPALDDPDRPDPIGDTALPIVRDALRTNDTRLIAAALGPYAAAHLDDDAWRQAVLKVLFTGIPVDQVAGLGDRADDELARMVRDYAAEREAAGRDVPPDARTVLALAHRAD